MTTQERINGLKEVLVRIKYDKLIDAIKADNADEAIYHQKQMNRVTSSDNIQDLLLYLVEYYCTGMDDEACFNFLLDTLQKLK